MNRRLFLKNTSQFSLALGVAQMLPWEDLLDFNMNTAENQFFKLSLAQWSLHKAILESKTLNPLDFPKRPKSLVLML